MALSKDLFEDKATLSLNVSDMFNSRKRQSYTQTASFIRDSEFQWRKRQVNLSFIYRFNQPKDRRQGNRPDGDERGGEEQGEFKGGGNS
jgi:hypothetical protein